MDESKPVSMQLMLTSDGVKAVQCSDRGAFQSQQGGPHTVLLPLARPPVQDGPKEWVLALEAAVAAIYFRDSSDYLSALWQVVKHLKPEMVEALESDEKSAFDKVKAMVALAEAEVSRD